MKGIEKEYTEFRLLKHTKNSAQKCVIKRIQQQNRHFCLKEFLKNY